MIVLLRVLVCQHFGNISISELPIFIASCRFKPLDKVMPPMVDHFTEIVLENLLTILICCYTLIAANMSQLLCNIPRVYNIENPKE